MFKILKKIALNEFFLMFAKALAILILLIVLLFVTYLLGYQEGYDEKVDFIKSRPAECIEKPFDGRYT
jgi:hypothetical protein